MYRNILTAHSAFLLVRSVSAAVPSGTEDGRGPTPTVAAPERAVVAVASSGASSFRFVASVRAGQDGVAELVSSDACTNNECKIYTLIATSQPTPVGYVPAVDLILSGGAVRDPVAPEASGDAHVWPTSCTPEGRPRAVARPALLVRAVAAVRPSVADQVPADALSAPSALPAFTTFSQLRNIIRNLNYINK
ncbi:unnamed protein product [Nezara viridula]|uniref:Neuropeptide n=1 Tax=Nezara viridula TaxID=85310 RepID=A0A9P0MQS9_NEZVI|nr:unnamed protein product [Nezara viridula]